MKPVTVPGKSRSEEAKIGGITPEVFTLSGRCELWPLYIRRPTTRFAYCTGMRRCARSMKTMAATTAIIRTTMKIATRMESSRWRTNSKVVTTADGMAATMPAKMMSEMPFPMPRSVICSPSHMMKAVPVVSVMTVIRRKLQPGWNTTLPPPGASIVSRPMEMKKPCTSDRRTVP